MVKFFSFFVLLVLVFDPFPVHAGQRELSQQLVKFELAAKKIADAIRKDTQNNKKTTTQKIVSAIVRKTKTDKEAMVFFAPFHSLSGIPIARSTANLYFTKFEESFLRHKPSTLKFIRSDNKHIKNNQTFKKSKYLVTSELELRNRDLTITFRTSKNGMSISTDIVRIFDLSSKDLKVTAMLAMPDVISQAAQKFTDYGKAPSEQGTRMKRLYWDYLSDGRHGNSTPFGRALMKQLAVDIQERFVNPLTRKQLITKRLPQRTKTLKNGDFFLSGSAELFGDKINIFLELSDQKDQVVSSWAGVIDRRTTGKLTYEGRSNAQALKELKALDKTRGVELKLTIPTAGKSNTLSIGEKWNLGVFVNKPAWIYCYYFFANKQDPEKNKTIMIFPNPATWSEYKTPEIPPQKIISIPRSTHSKSTQKTSVSFTASPPIGTELVKCFASQRDITMELPEELQGKEMEANSLPTLPDQMGSMLSDIFQDVDPMISESSLLITVIKAHLR